MIHLCESESQAYPCIFRLRLSKLLSVSGLLYSVSIYIGVCTYVHVQMRIHVFRLPYTPDYGRSCFLVHVQVCLCTMYDCAGTPSNCFTHQNMANLKGDAHRYVNCPWKRKKITEWECGGERGRAIVRLGMNMGGRCRICYGAKIEGEEGGEGYFPEGSGEMRDFLSDICWIFFWMIEYLKDSWNDACVK